MVIKGRDERGEREIKRERRPIQDQVRSHDHGQAKRRERTPWPPHSTNPLHSIKKWSPLGGRHI